MHNISRGAGRLLLSAALVAGTVAAGLTAATPVAASPCGNPGAGSSGLGSVDPGSLGSLAGPQQTPGAGPQGPLPNWRNGTSRVVSWVTGPRSPNDTLHRFAVSGTDLGISWFGATGQTLIALGDTFGDCDLPGQQWRNNVLLRTDDSNLADGLTIPDGVPGDIHSGAVVTAEEPNLALQMIPALGVDAVEITKIPTTAVHIDGAEYLNFMSVRQWGPSGVWDTNYSAVAVSHDNGQSWNTDLSTLRINAGAQLELPPGVPSLHPNNQVFQQNAYVRGRPDADDQRDWVYQFGTPNGRFGALHLARFRPDQILDLGTYQYWTGADWVSEAELGGGTAAQVVPAPMSELSVAWSPYLGKYVMIYSDNAIYLRTAERPEGPWSDPRTLVPGGALVVYGPMMLPGSPVLQGTGPELYFNASRWGDYNVMLIESKLQSHW